MKFSSITQLLVLMHCLLSIHATFGEINRDLELDALCVTIDHTHTIHGKNALRSLLAQPITDQQILEGRKTIIGHLADTTKLHVKLNAALKAFSKYEPNFEQIIQPADDIQTAALNDFYFSSDYCKEWNYSPACLEWGYAGHCANLCSSMVQHALAFAIFTWALEEQHVCPSHPAQEAIVPKPKKHSHKKNDSHKHHDHKHTTETPCTHHSHSDTAQKNFIKALVQTPQFRYAFQLWHGIAQIQELYSIQRIIRADMHRIKQLQIQLMGIARGIHLINQIHTLIKDQPEFTGNLAHYSSLENICNNNDNSKKLNALLTLLQTPTFKGQASAFSRIGIILAAHKLAQEISHELQPALAAIGEIDAYASCTQLYNHHIPSPYNYNFARYITNSTTPSLHAHNFWHPLVTAENIQLNNISLGTDNTPRNIIVTGPNACGKSTNVKALTLCAYLAQTITLVPAEQYSQTIYKEIYSSMVVSDNIEENMSLFVAELTSAEQLLEKVESLAAGEYMVIALDELFKSTHHEKGQLVAQRLLEKLYASPQVITLVSTHFEKLIELAAASNGTCANYTVNNFILEPGIGSPEHSFAIVNAQTISRLLQ